MGGDFWIFNQVEETTKPLSREDRLKSLFFKGQGVYLPKLEKYGIIKAVLDGSVTVKYSDGESTLLFDDVQIALANGQVKHDSD